MCSANPTKLDACKFYGQYNAFIPISECKREFGKESFFRKDDTKYIFAHENINDSTITHFCIVTKERIQKRNRNTFLSILYNEELYESNIKTFANTDHDAVREVILRIRTYEDVDENFDKDAINLSSRKRTRKEENTVEDELLVRFKIKHFRNFANFEQDHEIMHIINRSRYYWHRVWQRYWEQAMDQPTSYSLDQFTLEPMTEEFMKKSVFIYGKSGCGKTKYIEAHFQKDEILTIGKLSDLTFLVTRGIVYKAILFDDIPISEWKALDIERVLDIVDQESSCSFKVKGNTHIIPRGTKKFFSHNLADFMDFSHKISDQEQQAALDRLFNKIVVLDDIRRY